MEGLIPPWVVPGVSFRETYGNSNDKLWHVRGVVDGAVVCRYWRRHKNRWQYEVLDWTWFDVFNDRLIRK